MRKKERRKGERGRGKGGEWGLEVGGRARPRCIFYNIYIFSHPGRNKTRARARGVFFIISVHALLTADTFFTYC